MKRHRLLANAGPRGRILCLLLGTAHLHGCSLVLVRGPSKDRHAPVTCTRSNAWPVVDTVLASGYAVGAFYWATRSDDDPRAQDLGRGNAVAASLALAALTVLSAAAGYDRVDACRDASLREQRAHPQRLDDRPPPLATSAPTVPP